MRRLNLILLILVLSNFSTSVFAQSEIDSTDVPKFVYCELVGSQKLLSTKVNVSVDYGQERSFFQDMRMKDEETGKAQSFNSMVDALNYMGNFGWEFVQAYIVTTGQINVYHWLLKKKRNILLY